MIMANPLEKDPYKWKKREKDTSNGCVRISFGEVLSWVQSPEFEKDIDEFALLGFGRFNRFNRQHAPYRRGHVVSAVLLNIALLEKQELWFNPKIWVMEDLEFNERVNTAGLLICKCQRFAQVKKQMPGSGGCNLQIAGGSSVEPEPEPEPELEPEPEEEPEPVPEPTPEPEPAPGPGLAVGPLEAFLLTVSKKICEKYFPILDENDYDLEYLHDSVSGGAGTGEWNDLLKIGISPGALGKIKRKFDSV
jgi:hypothetical protein